MTELREELGTDVNCVVQAKMSTAALTCGALSVGWGLYTELSNHVIESSQQLFKVGTLFSPTL